MNLGEYARNMKSAKVDADNVQHALDALTTVSRVTEGALNRVKMGPGQAGESRASASEILSGVRGIGDEARKAAHDLDKVKLGAAQAAETTASGDRIDAKLKDITGNANEARRSLESVRLAGAGAGGGGGGGGRGGIGLLGAGIGAAGLLGPAAGPGALGLLASIPVLASTGAGALGTLALAFQGVGQAIHGNKKAFDSLVPAQKEFVLTVRSLDGAFDKLKQTAGANLFPGLTEAMHSALSPGTMAAITTAVTEFARAIGSAGAAWGRYFGSAEFRSIFGPLMAAGARNLGLMSDAALHLFDAIGVLARAAIPLTQWMVQGIDNASKYAASWLHAKDATGQLSGALNEAKTSLQLLGGLVGALLKTVYQLGAALYPVSKVAVKDLTDGLNALAEVFKRNQQTIREVVSGALTAFVAFVRGAVPVVKLIAGALKAVADNVGGWKNAFEIVLAGVLVAKLATLAEKIKGIGVAIGLIPKEAASARLLIDGELVTIGKTAELTTGKVASIKTALGKLAGTVATVGIVLSIIPKSKP